ncbi:MAG: FHA domain-containing protein [Desulfobacteraceae bacterium]|nr:FHA domain-containing protein [Desulfobacteraceae bacterium]
MTDNIKNQTLVNFIGKKAYLVKYPVESFSKPISIFAEKTYIGNDPDNAVYIPSTGVSEKHAVITKIEEHFYLTDNASRLGTYLNGNKVQEKRLTHHDRLTIGGQSYLFLLELGHSDDSALDTLFTATDTISLSEEEIDFSELLAQNADSAARGLFRQTDTDHYSQTSSSDRAYQRLSLLYQLSEKLRSTRDLDDILEKGLDLIFQAIPAASCSLIMLKSPIEGSLEVRAFKTLNSRHGASTGEVLNISRTLLDWVLTEKIALVSQDVTEDMRLEESESIRIQNVNSIICVPMIRQEKVVGVLYVDSNTVINPLVQEDAIFAAAVANEMALCIENTRLQQQALRNERMAAIGMTVANLAHNIRNLIALNQSAVDLMGMHLSKIDNPKIKKNWQWIKQSFDGINQLSFGMLEYAKADKIVLELTDINQMINSARGLIVRDGIEFDFQLAPENPKWMIDSTQCHRALLNLVVNAIHAVKDCEKAQIRIFTKLDEGNRLIIGVTDNGCGIMPEKQEKVFQLFFTTKGTEGTGLGLPMVQKLIERMGGELTFNSKAGIGSVFKMVFSKN